ncbi:hypothetical protein JXA40_05160 [bacterium]|nr:hypothetical protein [candidate division CSSED10-310 bacterium]
MNRDALSAGLKRVFRDRLYGCFAVLVFTVSAAAPPTGFSAQVFYGFHFDKNHLDFNDVGEPAWAITTVYGAPSETEPGPAPNTGDTFYDFCLDHRLTPVIRLEEAWWIARGMYLDHFPNDGILDVALGDSVSMQARPVDNFTWSSSDPAVGTVNDNGVFTAMGEGVCRIQAEGSQGSFHSSDIEVKPIVTRVKSSVLKNSTCRFYSCGSGQPHQWGVLEPDLARIDPDTGEFTALKAGTATVIVTDALGTTAECQVEIVDVWIRSTWPGFNNKAAVGDTIDLMMDGAVNGKIQWIFDPSVLRLDDPAGVFTVIGSGQTNLYLSTDMEERSNTIRLTAMEILISYPWKLAAVVNDTIQFSARRKGSAGFIWTVDNQSVGRVDFSGKFTALAPGICRVVVTDGTHTVYSGEITVDHTLVISEYWHFFDLWIEAWATRFPLAWFQYGNEIGSAADPYKTSFSTVLEGYVRALSHVSSTIRAVIQRPCMIAQGACDTTIFSRLLEYGLDAYVDAYAAQTYYLTTDMYYSTIPEPDHSELMDPDAWHESIMDNPGVSPLKPWFLSETSCSFNVQEMPTVNLLPTHFAYAKQFQSRTGKCFHAALWFTLGNLIDPPDELPDKPWEGYKMLLDFISRDMTPPPQNTVCLPLEKYFNLDGIASENDVLDGNFDSEGNTLAAEQLYCGATAQTIVDSIPWSVPSCSPGQLNVIACQGQILYLEGYNCSAIHLIGCGTGGSLPLEDYPRSGTGIPSTGVLGMTYGDFSYRTTELNFSNWTSGPMFGEYPASMLRYYLTPEGPSRFLDGEGNLDHDDGCFIWDYIVETDPEKTLKSLILPVNPDMKLLAITLETIPQQTYRIFLETNRFAYGPGDRFILDVSAGGGTVMFGAHVYILLNYAGEYWCWPGWETAPYGDCGKKVDLPSSGYWNEMLLDFYWPGGTGSYENLLILAALCDLQFAVVDMDYRLIQYLE